MVTIDGAKFKGVNARERNYTQGKTVEHPFGTLKSWMGVTHFLTKRLENVKTEMSLSVLAYNIRRMISMMGVRKLIGVIQA